MARFRSSILPPRPTVDRQILATATVQAASAAAVVEEKVLAVAADPGNALGDLLAQYDARLLVLENPAEP